MRNSKFETSDTSRKRIALLLLASVATIALIIRWTIAAGDALWLDELHTAWVVKGSLGEVTSRASIGNQSPLFFWITWCVVACLGQASLILRSFSVVCGTALVASAGWFTWRASKSATGVLVTSLLVALDWSFVFYATEARPYVLMQLLGLFQALTLAERMGWLPSSRRHGDHGSSWRWSIFTVLSIALFYTHTMSVWLFAAEAPLVAWAILFSQPSKKQQLSSLCLSAFTIFMACLPAALNVFQLLQRRGNWSGVSSIETLWAEASQPLLLWCAVPLLVWIACSVFSRWRQDASLARPSDERNDSNTRSPQLIWFLFAWAITPIAGVALAEWLAVAPLALLRYTTVGTVAMPILVGVIAGRLSSRPQHRWLALSIAAIAMFGIWSNNPITRQLAQRQCLPHLRTEIWDTPIATINSDASKANQPVFVFGNVLEDVDAFSQRDAKFQDYLLFPVSGFDSIHRHGRLVQACPTHRSPHLLPQHFAEIESSGGAWLLIRGRQPTIATILSFVERGIQQHQTETGSMKKYSIKQRGKKAFDVYAFSVDFE